VAEVITMAFTLAACGRQENLSALEVLALNAAEERTTLLGCQF
jgi:hypothetical protein